MISDTLKKLLTPQVDPSVKLMGVGLFLGKLLDKFDTRVTDLEARQLQKGDKGDSIVGPKGDKGDSIVGPKGDKGDKGDSIVGPKGDKGDRGPKGVSVVDAEVALDGNLVLKLSDGKIIDAGEIVKQGTHSQVIATQLANFQIVVSSTAPASPQVNDLWLDIS